MYLEKQMELIGKWGMCIIKGSVAWIIGNFIYIFLLSNLMFAENINETGTLLVTAYILIPFIFAPGTTAAFHCLKKIYQEDSISILKQFWSFYKRNYSVSFMNGLIYVVITFVLYHTFQFYKSFEPWGFLAPIIVGILFTNLFFFVLIYASDRTEKLHNYWKLGHLMLVNHPMFTLFMLSESAVVIYLAFLLGPFMLLVAPGIVLFIFYHFYHEIIKAEIRKVEKIEAMNTTSI